nr:MAG: hypothetical protein DIU60_05720 [Actinomycetota bacterium]
MRIRPLLCATITAAALACLTAAPATASVRHSPGGGTDVVEYECRPGAGVTGETQRIRVQVELTMPTGAWPGVELVIGWRGAYVDGSQLTAPQGELSGLKLYAYAGISDVPGFTSATGVADLPEVSPGGPVPLPEGTVELRSTPNRAGVAAVRPGAINFGRGPTAPLIECDVQNRDALRTYPLTIGDAGGDATPTPTSTDPAASEPPASTPTASPTGSPTATTSTDTTDDTPDDTADDTATTASGKVARTPAGSVATGGGGEAGPDARLILLGGLALTAAGTGGLLWQRLRPRRT